MTDRIADALKIHLPNAKLQRTWALEGGISAHMTAFEIETDKGTQTLIARKPNSYAYGLYKNAAKREFEILQQLYQKGLPIQKPIFVEDQTEEVPQPFFAIEYIEGKPDVNPKNPTDFLEKYASQLAQIHRTSYNNINLKRQASNYELKSSENEHNEKLRETEIRNALATLSHIKQSNPPVLRHGDFWPGNVLWRDNEIVGVIDWEEAIIGEPLADLAICRLDLLWILGSENMALFTDLYQTEMNLDLTDLPYWDLCASLRPISNIDQWSPSFAQLGRSDVTTETMSRDHQLFVTQALNALR